MIYQQINIRVRRGMPTNKSRTMREGRGHVQRRRQGLWHERRHADAAQANLAPASDLHGVARASIQLGGLLGLSIIHFARWVLIKRNQWPDLGQGKQKLQNDYMLFCSNFNGTWDQYIDAFSDGIPGGLDLFWYSSTRYPHSIPITSFKNYIRANQIDTDYYYNATPGAAQRDIKSALRIRLAILELAKLHKDLEPADFQKAYIEILSKKLNGGLLQNGLGYQGYAPVASNDADSADKHRNAYVRDQPDAAHALL